MKVCEQCGGELEVREDIGVYECQLCGMMYPLDEELGELVHSQGE